LRADWKDEIAKAWNILCICNPVCLRSSASIHVHNRSAETVDLVPVVSLTGAILCAQQVLPWRTQLRSRTVPRGKTAIVGWVLLAYALTLFVYFYRTTGGASSVSIVNGQYFYMYQGHMLRPITQEQYEIFPTQWFRVMSAWMGMMATFCLSSLLNASRGPSAQ
jgi:hypothetical protein